MIKLLHLIHVASSTNNTILINRSEQHLYEHLCLVHVLAMPPQTFEHTYFSSYHSMMELE